VVKRPNDMNAFEFAVLAGLRAAQLQRGCAPRVEQSAKIAVTAQHEVAAYKVLPLREMDEPGSRPNEVSDSSPLAPTS
jgi:DNA-directed RNA polymerase subunit K/omega